MSEVLQTNIFFYITSAAVVVVTLLIVAVLVYVLLIVRNVKELTDKLREGSDLIASDLMVFRERLKATGSKLQRGLGFFAGRVFPRRRRGSRKNSRKEADESTEE